VALCSCEGWGFYGCFNSWFGEGLGGLFSLAEDLQAFLDELVCLPFLKVGNLESILFISPVADL
jgi:hypothetical protein